MPRCLIHDDRDVSSKLLEEHHRHPTAYGGPDVAANICWLCPSCHDAVHRISHDFYARRLGSARDLIDQYLPNQPARRVRLEDLCRIVAESRRQHRSNGKIPEAGAEADRVKMTIEVPAWVHHRLKTVTLGKGLYKSVEAVLTQFAIDATRGSGGSAQVESEDIEAPGSGPLPLIDLTQD